MNHNKSIWINTRLEYDFDGNLLKQEGFWHGGDMMLADPPPQIKQLSELEGKLKTVQDRTALAYKEAAITPEGQDGKAVYDFNLVKAFGENMTTTAIAEAFAKANAEMDDMGVQIETLRGLQAANEKQNAPVASMIHPASEGNGLPGLPGGQLNVPQKTIGEMITEHKGYAAMLSRGGRKTAEIEIPGYGLADIKTLFQTSAGWAPESVRMARVVDAVTRPLQVIDLIPGGSIGQAAAVYMEETTRTHASAETAEGAAYKESTFVLTERNEPVRKITDSIPVTDEQLEDVAFAQSYLDNRIRFGIQQRLDLQLIQGDGSTPNLTGILNKSGIQTQAKSTDPVPDAVYKAMTLIRVTGRATPTGIIMHPNDWQAVRLLRTADGIYIWGNPSEAGPERMWGLPVAQADSLDENTAIVGSFADWCQLLERRGLVVEIGFVGTQFIEGEQTLRASMRVVFVIYRAAAFCTVTGI